MTKKRNIYFIGIGGIGMSALARYFLALGYRVAGYDKTETTLTKKLVEEGVKIHYEDDLSLIDKAFKSHAHTLVIITPAIPENHSEWNFFKEEGFEILKRAQVLGRITETNKSIGVAGTHGKTTISSMISYIFKYCKVPFTAFLGGISKDLGSNYYYDTKSEITVIEADEYDRSFLELKPTIATVSAIDPDHLDIYGTQEEMQKTFKQYLDKNIQKNGIGIIHNSLTKILGNHHKTYSLEDVSADYHALNFRVENAEFLADFKWLGGEIKDVKIGLPGIHNMENALLAFAVAIENGINPKLIKEALGNYSGVERRFDVHIKSNDLIYIDDYAHHPEEIKKLVNSVRKMYPKKDILGIFQPHLFSRTLDFADGFARSLELLDELLLLEIYPARELPIPGVDSRMLFERINMNSKTLCSKKELTSYVSASKCNVVLTIGAGDIGAEVENLKKFLLKH
ncbi:MAG: UDP-N-acetylmuramate--L-alanine ligase [Flavobacteriales bacterium]|nr:UDP-N-acetylmuramate--L-alanine ligase [Flavobacteriales bacterium]